MNDFSKVLPVVMAAFLGVLRDQTVLSRVVNRDFASTPAQQGTKVSVTLPSSYEAYDRVAAATHTLGQNTAPERVDIPLDQWKAVDMFLTDKEWGEIQRGGVEPQLQAMAETMAKTINTHLISQVARSVSQTVGTAGAFAFASSEDTYLEALQKLNEANAPESGRFAIVTAGEYRRALKIANLVQAQTRGDGQAIVTGQLGQAYGAAIFRSNLVPTHTSNALGAGAITVGADSAKGAVAVTIAKGAGANWSAKAGDVLTIGTLQTTVTADTTVVQGASTNVPVTALTAAIVNGTAITVATQAAGGAATSATCLVAHRDAIYLASRPLQDFQGTAQTFSITDDVTGLTFRAEIVRLNGATKLIIDCLFGATTVRPELAVRMLGGK